MLVLGRKVQQSIMIGPDIEVKVLSIEDNGLIRIGINAPRHIEIGRKEHLEKMKMDSENNGNIK